MILAIDIGNTNLTIGCFDGEQICFAERLSTDLTRTDLEYAVSIKTILELYGIKKAGFGEESSPRSCHRLLR